MTTYKIVGAHFHPPAKAILQSLPGGAELILRPEPDNQYDPNAVMVLVESATIPASEHETLGLASAGYGVELSELLGAKEWHLGYVPRTEAIDLAPQLDGEQILGRLVFDAKGAPCVKTVI